MKKLKIIALLISLLISLLFIISLLVDETDCNTLKTCKEQARQGDASAQYNLGIIYHYGIGVTKSYQIAMKWYTKAAEQGYAKARSAFSVMCEENGGLVNESCEKAVEWSSY